MQESGEMYLETILTMLMEKSHIRSVDVAEEMGYSKASVSRAFSKLKADDCIVIDNEGFISLTEKGKGIAEKIYERHVVLSRLLMSLGVDEQTATDDACKIEHVISEKSFDAIKASIASHR